ncbi:MAG: hypothetical protein AB7N65_25365 [Vicinamibacterales bacterium]
MRSVVTFVVMYGFTSSVRPMAGASRPTIVAPTEASRMPPVPRPAGTRVKYEISFFQVLLRRALKPHPCAWPER